MNSKTDEFKWEHLTSIAKRTIEPAALKGKMIRFQTMRYRYIELESVILSPKRVMALYKTWNYPVKMIFRELLYTQRDDEGWITGTCNYWGGYHCLKLLGVPPRPVLQAFVSICESAAQFETILLHIQEMHELHKEIIPVYNELEELFTLKKPYGVYCANLKCVTPVSIILGIHPAKKRTTK